MDDPDPYANFSTTEFKPRRLGGYGVAFARLSFILVLLISIALKYPVAWFLVVFQTSILVVGLLGARQRQSLRLKSAAVQRAAKESIGASLLGSGIHTAGHPLLERDQRVVLALRGSELSIYGYADPRPIHSLPVGELQSVDLIVYDDDHVPHAGAIDNSAQALQLAFPWKDETCICQFRWMYKVRPVDWYHGIQSARLMRT